MDISSELHCPTTLTRWPRRPLEVEASWLHVALFYPTAGHREHRLLWHEFGVIDHPHTVCNMKREEY